MKRNILFKQFYLLNIKLQNYKHDLQIFTLHNSLYEADSL